MWWKYTFKEQYIKNIDKYPEKTTNTAIFSIYSNGIFTGVLKIIPGFWKVGKWVYLQKTPNFAIQNTLNTHCK